MVAPADEPSWPRLRTSPQPHSSDKLMRFCWPVLCALLAASPVSSAELLPSGTPINEAIDHYLEAGWVEAKVKPAPLVSGAGLVRRMTLDLAGRIPTVGETRAFVDSGSPSRWTALADRLLSSSANNCSTVSCSIVSGRCSARAGCAAKTTNNITADNTIPNKRIPRRLLRRSS